MSREWFIFFQHLNTLLGGGSNDTSILDLQVGPHADVTDLDALLQNASLSNGNAFEVRTELVETSTSDTMLDEMQKQLDGLSLAPVIDISSFSNSSLTPSSAPVIKTSDFTLSSLETWVINNKAASTCIVTLPAASTVTGRVVTFKNVQAFTLVSNASNVVPIDSTSAGTSILLGVVGNWATIVSDGTNWVIMQQAPNNILLLE